MDKGRNKGNAEKWAVDSKQTLGRIVESVLPSTAELWGVARHRWHTMQNRVG